MTPELELVPDKPSNVVKFYPRNASDSADMVLEQAVGHYQDVLIIGYDHNGNREIRSSSYFANGGALLWLIEQFKLDLLNGVFKEEPEDE
jgi:hypothetical protein